MGNTTNTAVLDASAAHFPDHGPVADSGKEVLLSLKHVDINFGKGENIVRAVRDASFDVYKGETFSLVGESGSGKTTIGRAIIRANTCSAGEILYKGVRISGKIPRSLDREVIRRRLSMSGLLWTILFLRDCTIFTCTRTRRTVSARWSGLSRRWACFRSI